MLYPDLSERSIGHRGQSPGFHSDRGTPLAKSAHLRRSWIPPELPVVSFPHEMPPRLTLSHIHITLVSCIKYVLQLTILTSGSYDVTCMYHFWAMFTDCQETFHVWRGHACRLKVLLSFDTRLSLAHCRNIDSWSCVESLTLKRQIGS